MSAIQMSLDYNCPAVELPCAFIDRYMCTCTPVYALIYIYGFRQCADGAAVVSYQEISKAFQILETDVVNAWHYWENEGLIRLESNGDGLIITFLPVNGVEAEASPLSAGRNKAVLKQFVPKQTEAKRSAQGQSPQQQTEYQIPRQTPQEQSSPKSFVPAGRPQYTVEELTVYRQQSRDIERLFKHAEQALGKLLTFHDMNVLFGFYDWLRLPVDVISYLLTYCAENDRRDLRYIEKAAMDWAENHIDDLDSALEYVQTFDRDYREILKAFGQTSGYPTPTQRKYIHKWLKDYAMPVEMLLEACDRAAVNTGKVTLKYVDKIIEGWRGKDIRTPDAAKAADEDFARKKLSAKAEPKPVKTNRFVNFKQRERNYAELEKMEREYLMQSLKG